VLVGISLDGAAFEDQTTFLFVRSITMADSAFKRLTCGVTHMALEAGTLEPVNNLQEGQQHLAFDLGTGNLASAEVQQVTESQLQSGNLVKIQCSSGIQATCFSESVVLIKDKGAKYKKVHAGDLASGDNSLMFQVLEETVAAVTEQHAPQRIIPLDFTRGAVFCSVDSLCGIMPATIQHGTYVDCWGPSAAHTIQDALDWSS